MREILFCSIPPEMSRETDFPKKTAKTQALCRELTNKCRAMSGGALDPNRAVVPLHNMLHNGQTQPGSAQFTRPRLIDSIEPLKKPGVVLSRNSRSTIRNFERHKLRPRATPMDFDRAPHGSVFTGIIQKIDEHLLNPPGIGSHRVCRTLKSNALVFCMKRTL